MISFKAYSGRMIDLERPRPEDINILDIARGLSHCCRFAGQLPRFYSVAQHSVMVSQLVDPPLRLAALLHDASEAYLGDLNRNLKHHELLRGYRVLEERLQDAINDKFLSGALTPTGIDDIKDADNLAAIFEQVRLREECQDFLPATDIYRLVAADFVQSAPDDLMRLVPRLPGTPPNRWEPLPSAYAETNFLFCFHTYIQ